MLNVQHRSGVTHKKTITLTDAGREQIQTFSDAHKMTFSAAIETLALIGMEADLTALLIPLINNSVEKGLQRNFNRMAKLTILAAAEAAMAHDLTTMLLLQTVRQEAVSHPEDFETRIPVSRDRKQQPDARIREMYNQMRRLARQRQRKLLQQSLRDLLNRLDGSELDIADSDEEATDE
ncbi:MAG: hypothetical protein DWQ04_03985 [Chloroflexi bacterium]|nr:MAG: hypothetical protein DWQ04_03985 [Chloroflexota bacterium]